MSRPALTLVSNNPMPAYMPPRAPLSDDGSDAARGFVNGMIAGSLLWGIGVAVWWAVVSGACK